jgi:hypothetical protein
MGDRTSLTAATLAASHTSASFKAGRSASVLVTQAQTQFLDVIKTLQEIVKDMQAAIRTSRRSIR